MITIMIISTITINRKQKKAINHISVATHMGMDTPILTMMATAIPMTTLMIIPMTTATAIPMTTAKIIPMITATTTAIPTNMIMITATIMIMAITTIMMKIWPACFFTYLQIL